MAVGGVVPFDVGELTVVANVFVCEAAVQEQTGDISVLGLVGCVKLIGMIIKPKLQLLLWSFFVGIAVGVAKVWRPCGERGW